MMRWMRLAGEPWTAVDDQIKPESEQRAARDSEQQRGLAAPGSWLLASC